MEKILKTILSTGVNGNTSRLKLGKASKGLGLKESTKKATEERIAPLRLEEDNKNTLNFSENGIFVKEVMGRGSSEMQILRNDGELSRTKD